MECLSACQLINELVLFEPGWKFTATDHTNRFEGTIKVRIEYPAQNTNRDQAADGYPERICTYAEFTMTVADCGESHALYHKLFKLLMKVHEHESREYFRIRPTNYAPFHPHRIGGMERWGTTDSDLLFGVT